MDGFYSAAVELLGDTDAWRALVSHLIVLFCCHDMWSPCCHDMCPSISHYHWDYKKVLLHTSRGYINVRCLSVLANKATLGPFIAIGPWGRGGGGGGGQQL